MKKILFAAFITGLFFISLFNSTGIKPVLADTIENKKVYMESFSVDDGSIIANEIIVKYKNKEDISKAFSYFFGQKNIEEKIEKIKVENKEQLIQRIEELKNNPNVEFIQPNYKYKKSDISKKSDINNANQNNKVTAMASALDYNNEPWYFNNLEVRELWKQSTGKGIKVAVIDTGIDASHEDLVGKVVGGMDFTADNDPYLDRSGLGTFSAGIIAADKENNIGTCGIAYDSKLLSVKVVDGSGYSETTNVGKGIRWATDNGAKVINIGINISISQVDNIVKEAIDYAVSKGCIIVTTAGTDINDPLLYSNSMDNTIPNPLSFDNVISVGAINEANEWCFFSNIGEKIDLVAPGCNTYSTIPHTVLEGGYTVYNGTSVSAAIVSSQLALILSKQPQLTTKDILNKIKDSTFKLGKSCPNKFYGYGILDVKKVLTGVAGKLNTTETSKFDDNIAKNAQTIVCPKKIDNHLKHFGDVNWYKIYIPENTAVKISVSNIVSRPGAVVFPEDLKYAINYMSTDANCDWYISNPSSARYFYVETFNSALKEYYEDVDECSFTLDMKYLPISDLSIPKDETFKWCIDNLKQGETVSGNILNIDGWALSYKIIYNLQAKLDNQIINLTHNLVRQDVLDAYGEYSDLTSGFTGGFDISKLSYGKHQLTLIATYYNGTVSLSKNITFNVSSTLKKNIDTIKEGMSITDTSLAVNGWALSKDSIRKIEAVIDNSTPVELKYGQVRQDVYNAFKNYSNKNSGFSGKVDIRKYGYGFHKVKLKITYVSGRTELTEPISFNKVGTLKGSLDTVKPKEIIKRNSLHIGGWAISKKGVAKVEAIIDNNKAVTLNYGHARTDVYNVFKDYNNKKSGYDGILDISRLTLGEHRIKIRVTETDGVSGIVNEIPFIVENLIYNIDTPSQGKDISANTLSIGGWVLSRTGVQKIEAIIDGNTYYVLKYGATRVDVYNAFKDFNDKNSGFNGIVDISKLSYGKHEVQIKITDKLGVVNTSKAVSINIIQDTKLAIDTPSKGQSVTGRTLDISGWILSSSKVTKIEALVDGKAYEIKYGLSRLDVYNAFKNYNDKNSGFVGKLNIGYLSFGTHSLAIRYTDKREKITVSKELNFTINNSFKYCIDTPRDNIKVTDDYIEVSGWALNKVGIAKANILIDGLSVYATYGLSRIDVYNVFKDYNNENSGFYGGIYLPGFSEGRHTLIMEFTDIFGRVSYSNELTIYIDRGKQIDTTSIKEILDYNNKITLGKAFRITREYAAIRKDTFVKYSYDVNMSINEDNLCVFMMDEEGMLNTVTTKPIVDKINNTVTFANRGLGVYVIDDKERVASIIRR